MAIREKYNLVQSLQEKSSELVGSKKLSLIGQGDFSGANNVARAAMNIKHHTQSLTIDNPEFPFLYEGKENLVGEHSSFYERTDRQYKVIGIVKKYDELLKGKCNIALYFMYCSDDDSYKVVERKEVENLVENFGFDYKNDFLDNAELGEVIPAGTVLYTSTSYDEDMNVSTGINGRILYGAHPAVQDDAIVISESFANKMISNQVTSKTIPINDNTIFLNLYDKDGGYQGLPNIGDVIEDGILAATRNVKETRMFSDLRDSSLSTINQQSDQVFYATGEIIDINVYCNNPNLKINKVNKQLIQYYNDAKWFYTDVYKHCKKIINSGSKNIDKTVNRWMRIAMDYLDSQAVWSFNENIFPNMLVEILIRSKEPIRIGRKIVGRHGNKTVVCGIWPDEEMPYLTTDCYKDENGVVHPGGEKLIVDMIKDPQETINRSIPMALYEPSITFITDKVRQHMKVLSNIEEQEEFMFGVLGILNPVETKHKRDLYKTLSDRARMKYIESCINEGIYVRWEAFNNTLKLRDAIIEVYEKYGDIIEPYNIFIPKPKWGRDIYIGKDCIGFQYILLLKQSGERGFSARSAGAISDESLPEKSHENKIGKLWHSETPIRFGEYETPNFMIITQPEDFALVSALYRSSVDGRGFMYEAILSEDGRYDIPDKFTSRTAEILQVYLKSLGVRMETVLDEDEYIGEPEHNTDVVGYNLQNNHVIFCYPGEMYYLNKLAKVYKKYIKENPNTIDDVNDVWSYIMENIPFKKKHLTDNIIKIFKNNMEAFSQKKWR